MEIGQRVKWKVGAIESVGVFLEEVDKESSKVFIHKIGNQLSGREGIVKTSILHIC